MFPYRMLAMIALLFVAGGAGAAAQEGERPRDRNCEDDRGVDRCDAEQQRKMRALYGLEPIETHLARGDIVRRAMFVDGYGRDVVAISFVRPRGADPFVSVHGPAGAAASRPEPLTAAMPREVWDALIARSEHFDKELAPPVEVKPEVEKKREKPVTESGGGETMTICLHSWVYVVEATEAPRSPASGIGKVRRAVEDACENGLAEPYASELAKAAVPLLPPCAQLDPKQHRNLPSLLQACSWLSGDRLAAAEVMNAIEKFRFVEGPSDAVLLHGIFDSSTELDWQGTSVKGYRAAETWAAKTEGSGSHLYYGNFEGLTADEVRFTGILSRASDGPDDETVYHRAPVEQIWVRDGGRFEIKRATVGPWEKES